MTSVYHVVGALGGFTSLWLHPHVLGIWTDELELNELFQRLREMEIVTAATPVSSPSFLSIPCRMQGWLVFGKR